MASSIPIIDKSIYFDLVINECKYILSITLPVYNKLHYLNRTFSSILKSEMDGEWEIVAVDANSNDGSYKYLLNLARNYKHFQVIKRNTQTTSNYARMIAAEESKGNYIWNVDPDDEIVPNFIEKTLIPTIKEGFIVKSKTTRKRVDFDTIEFCAYIMRVINNSIKKGEQMTTGLNITNNKKNFGKIFIENPFHWELWAYAIRRTIYIQALNFIIKNIEGYEKVSFATDLFHFISIANYVRYHKSINKFGYIYYSMNNGSITKNTGMINPLIRRKTRSYSVVKILDLVHKLYDGRNIKISPIFDEKTWY